MNLMPARLMNHKLIKFIKFTTVCIINLSLPTYKLTRFKNKFNVTIYNY
jgi:hypothetical protein